MKIKKIFFLMLGISSAYAGSYDQNVFFLDTSVQNYYVSIYKPTFSSTYKYDFNNYIQCTTPTNSNFPIFITGMQEGAFHCTQSNPLGLQKNGSYPITENTQIEVNGQTLIIPNPYYIYDPWDNTGKTASRTYLIYLDSNGKLSVRGV